jgi:hypothetical protein
MTLFLCGVQVAKTAEDQKGLHEQLEWVLPYYDPVTTRQESLTDEICRLQNVKSYLLLDNERDAAFDRITDLATRIFDVSIVHVQC